MRKGVEERKQAYIDVQLTIVKDAQSRCLGVLDTVTQRRRRALPYFNWGWLGGKRLRGCG